MLPAVSVFLISGTRTKQELCVQQKQTASSADNGQGGGILFLSGGISLVVWSTAMEVFINEGAHQFWILVGFL